MTDIDVVLEVSELTGLTVHQLTTDMTAGEIRLWRAVLEHRDRYLGASG